MTGEIDHRDIVVGHLPFQPIQPVEDRFSPRLVVAKQLGNDVVVKTTFLRFGRIHEILRVLVGKLEINVLRFFKLAHPDRQDIEIRLCDRARLPAR